jgi:hypothetical protein
MPPLPILSFIGVQADPASQSGAFVAGLLNPAAPVPTSVSGQTPRRYAVYRNNVTVSLVRAMEANFPVVRRLLGEHYFAGLAREFVQLHPPQSPLMFYYGVAFSDYLKAQADLKEYPYLGDVAKLEQQMRLSYHEADAPCLFPQALTDIAEDALETATFTAHPAMAIVQSDFAVHAIYRANQGDNAEAVEDVAKAEAVLVTRPQHDVELHALTASQCVFFSSLAAQKNFGEAADAAFASDDNFDLTGTLSLLLMSGAFQSIQTEKTDHVLPHQQN